MCVASFAGERSGQLGPHRAYRLVGNSLSVADSRMPTRVRQKLINEVTLLPAMVASLAAVGCGASALYGPRVLTSDSKVILDRGVCILSAVHESLHSADEQCGPAELAIPIGEHHLLAVYRANPYLDSEPFLL